MEWNSRTFTPDQQGDWRDVLGGFDALIAREEVKPLTHDWIDAYDTRRVRQDIPPGQAIGVAPETPLPAPEPHAINDRP